MLKRLLVNCILQGSTGLESRDLNGRDLNNFLGARITTGTSGAITYEEGAETDQGNALTLSQSFFNGIDKSIDGKLSLLGGNIGFLGDGID